MHQTRKKNSTHLIRTPRSAINVVPHAGKVKLQGSSRVNILFDVTHDHFHVCTPPLAPVDHWKAGIPFFCVLVNLLHLVLFGGKSSIIDRVLNSVPPPPAIPSMGQ